MPSRTKQSDETQLAVMANDISYIKENIDRLSQKLDENFVTKVEFEPIRKIVYGLVTLILIAVVGALLTLVLKK